ncbi:transcription factor TFIIIB subunit brf1 [Coniosporium apollinis]|uniref:Transcription factor TFIIIB subunit brf1 n=1 Tax=Coniosporium apollinis TaxID=61459 RepID=A0ABQ9NSM7_9PEZI|nr:transcription factor TFIIIB subunit brf1 [Coniosporium apollinis]
MSTVRPRAPLRDRQPTQKEPTKPQKLSSIAASSAPAAHSTKRKKQCCSNPDPVEEDGQLVCGNCAKLLEESNVVSEVTFGETSGGAAVVQGAHVGEGQRYAKTMGTGLRGLGGESRGQGEANGLSEIRRLAAVLSINDPIPTQAHRIYQLALNGNFTTGRRPRSVAAVCLYIACRKQPRNKVLLMDFAEKIQVNVYKLGELFRDLQKCLFMQNEKKAGDVPIIDVEELIKKYARKLEFGNMEREVVNDAARILKRMNRDWMVTGRHPAGLCGACIILAAGMNNFRRTVREVVYTVKVADMTIRSRIDEFQRTQSAGLTVKQFQEYGERLKTNIEPPAVYKRREREERERKRKRVLELGDEPEMEPESEEQTAAGATDASSAAPREPRRDKDGFVIPELPIDPTLLAAANSAHSELEASEASEQTEAPKKKRGRPPGPATKKRKTAPEVPELTEEDLLAEAELETEMNQIITSEDAVNNMEEAKLLKYKEQSAALANQLRTDTANMEEDIDNTEFDDDPEIANCILSDVEMRIKERIWVTHNEDWLRAQQRKNLKKRLDEASSKNKKAKEKKPREFHPAGDPNIVAGETPPESPAEATERMLKKRGARGYSRFINYERLKEMDTTTKEPGKSPQTSSQESRAASQSPAPSVASVATSVSSRASSRRPSLAGWQRASMSPAPSQASSAAGGTPRQRLPRLADFAYKRTPPASQATQAQPARASPSPFAAQIGQLRRPSASPAPFPRPQAPVSPPATQAVQVPQPTQVVRPPNSQTQPIEIEEDPPEEEEELSDEEEEVDEDAEIHRALGADESMWGVGQDQDQDEDEFGAIAQDYDDGGGEEYD